MAVAWESVSVDPTTATADTSMVVAKPAGLAVGDLLLGFGGCVNSRTIAAPNVNWTVVANDTGPGGTDPRVYVWAKVADAADVAATDFTFTTGTFASAVVAVHRISGAGAGTPTSQFSTGPNSQTQQCPSVTTPAANCLVFWGAYSASLVSSTADKGTERVDAGNSSAACWMAQYTDVVAAAGSVAGAVITTVGFGAKRVYSVAVEPAAGGSIAPIVAHLNRLRRAG